LLFKLISRDELDGNIETRCYEIEKLKVGSANFSDGFNFLGVCRKVSIF
jgi:hypothetical protein